MQIIKIRAKFSKEIEDDIRSEMEGIPEEVMEGIEKMAHVAANIHERILNSKAINISDVTMFNNLAYKIFPKRQDGGEFTKVERPGGSKIEFRPIKLRDQEPAEAPGIKIHKAVPYNMPTEENAHRFYFNGKSFELIPEAQWIRMSDGDAPYSCSNCCRTGRGTKFCPHCGARMEDKA